MYIYTVYTFYMYMYMYICVYANGNVINISIRKPPGNADR